MGDQVQDWIKKQAMLVERMPETPDPDQLKKVEALKERLSRKDSPNPLKLLTSLYLFLAVENEDPARPVDDVDEIASEYSGAHLIALSNLPYKFKSVNIKGCSFLIKTPAEILEVEDFKKAMAIVKSSGLELNFTSLISILESMEVTHQLLRRPGSVMQR